MSVDRRVTEDVLQTLEDGRDGFEHAAKCLDDSDRPDLASTMRGFAMQRGEFIAELTTLAAAYGDDVDEDGSALAAVHRMWMSLKDSVTGAEPDGILDVAEQGEDHAVAEYEKALEQDISPDLRTTLQRQLAGVRMAHDEVRALRNAQS